MANANHGFTKPDTRPTRHEITSMITNFFEAQLK